MGNLRAATGHLQAVPGVRDGVEMVADLSEPLKCGCRLWAGKSSAHVDVLGQARTVVSQVVSDLTR